MNSKPRIMRIVNRFNLGGPTYNASYLTKYLEDEYETLLIGGRHMESEASSLHIPESLNLNVEVIPELNRQFGLSNDIVAYRRIAALIRKFRPDIVHSHASKAGALGRIAARLNGVNTVVHTFHGHVFEHYFNPLKTKAVIRIERYLAGITDRIIALSESQKDDFVRKFRIAEEGKINVLPLGFDLERFSTDQEKKRANFRTLHGLAEDDIAIGIIGRLVPVKDHHFFLHCFSDLKEQGISARAFIIGDGELKEGLSKLCSDLGLSTGDGIADVVFTSWIREIDRVIPGLDIVALTSKNEGTPVSLIEAQASGIPVISTRVGGIEEVLLDRQSGFLSERGNDIDFVKNLIALVSDKELRVSMGEKGREYVRSRFGLSRLIDDTGKLYRELLSRRAELRR